MKKYIEAKNVLDNHGIIAFPTDTVMGFGIYYDDYLAYCNLNKVKNRPEDKPYTMMVSSIKELKKYAYLDKRLSRVIKAYMPGALTLLLKSKNVPDYVTHGTGVIGVRMPSNEAALSLLKYLKKPLLVPSANRSGALPCISSEEVKKTFGDEIGFILEGSCASHTPSTVIDFTKTKPVLVRGGTIKYEDVLDFYE